MTKSNAKKYREKLTREGKRNPEQNRSPFVFSDMRTRKTKTKKDSIYKCKYKNHFSHEGKDGSFLFPYFFSFKKASMKGKGEYSKRKETIPE